jgi:hypothetical protein
MGPRLSHSTIILEHRFLGGRSDLKIFVKLSSSPIVLYLPDAPVVIESTRWWGGNCSGEGAERRKRAVVGGKILQTPDRHQDKNLAKKARAGSCCRWRPRRC